MVAIPYSYTKKQAKDPNVFALASMASIQLTATYVLLCLLFINYQYIYQRYLREAEENRSRGRVKQNYSHFIQLMNASNIYNIAN